MKKKNILSKLIIAVFLLAIIVPLAISFAAPDKPVFRVTTSNANPKVGDKITLKIYLENIASIKRWSGFDVTLEYNEDAFEYVSSDTPLYGKDYFTNTPELRKNGKGVLFITMIQTFIEDGNKEYQASSYEGEIGEVTLQVKEGAAGTYDGTNGGFNIKIDDFFSDTGEKDDNGFLVFEHHNDSKIELPSVTVDAPIKDISLSTENMKLVKGQKEKIEITPNPTNTTTAKNASFVSNDTSVATVTNDGTVTALGSAGKVNKTTITVTAYGITKTVNVEVINPIKGISLNNSTLQLSGEDATATLVATIEPSDTFDSKEITWSSSDDKVVKVSNGKVTVVGGGTATITATTSNGIKAECIVTVVIPLKSVTLNKENVEIAMDPDNAVTDKLVVDYEPKNTTENTTASYTSNNTSIVTVSNTGVITPVAPGETTITVKLGSITKTVKVKVTAPLKKVTLNKTNVELLPGQTDQLEVSLYPTYTSDSKKVTWTSSNDDVVKVDENGKITAVKDGTATITATVAGKSAQASVKVLVPVEGIIILPNSNIELTKGGKITLSVKASNANAEEELGKITWKSSNPEIATVDQSGNVTAIAGGSTKITATTVGGKSATAEVKVIVPIKNISLNTDKLTINRGNSSQLELTIDPEDTTDDKTVTWTSSDTDVATVSNTGKVTAKKIGTTIITAKVGTHEVRCTVTVNAPIKSIKINSADLTLNKGTTQSLSVTINPEDTTDDKTITWESSDTKVVEVDENGTIVAKGAGSATITATVGKYSSSIKVTVIIPIVSFTVSQEEMTIIKGSANSKVISTVINPEDTTEDKTITWTSSNPNIIEVDENGKVTGLKEGTAKITGTLKNGKTVTVDVTVEIIPLTDIEVKVSDTILKGKSESIIVNPIPENSTELENVEYVSSDDEIASVDENGVITGHKEGKVIITITVGDITKEVEINIMEVHAESIIANAPSKELEVGQTTQVDVLVNPTTTTDELTYTYSSSDNSIATVDEQGIIKGLKVGKVTITVTASNGMKSSFEITIKKAAKKPTVNPSTSVSSFIPYLVLSIVSLLLILALFIKKSRI